MFLTGMNKCAWRTSRLQVAPYAPSDKTTRGRLQRPGDRARQTMKLLRAGSPARQAEGRPSAFPLKNLLQSSNIDPKFHRVRRSDVCSGAQWQRSRSREDA